MDNNRQHAIVLGASMAGLLAARVLAHTFERVTLVERDQLPSAADNRRGVPRGRHVHALPQGGADIIDELFPGLLARTGRGRRAKTGRLHQAALRARRCAPAHTHRARRSPVPGQPTPARGSGPRPGPRPGQRGNPRRLRLRRLVVIGDAMCSFNPIYGQGMSVAAKQAMALRTCLRRGDRNLARRYFRSAAKPIDTAWRMAIGSDLALPQVEGPRPLTVRLINAYIHRLLVAAEHDPIIATRFLRVSTFLDKPPGLMTLPIIARVIGCGDTRQPSAQDRQTGRSPW